jgi:acetyl-CoA carboxylase biotin carboxylase subunit
MLRKLLVANRGEIAVRVIRAARDLGIATVAVYSDADRDSLHVQIADEAVNIGPPAAKKSYLNVANILKAAADTGCDAVHPGFRRCLRRCRVGLCRAKWCGDPHNGR